MMATLRPAISERSASFSYSTVAGISGDLPSHGTHAGCLALQLGKRDPAGALQLHDAIGAEELLEVVDLVRVAVEADGHLLGAHGQDLALEDLHQLEHLAADLGGGLDGGEHQLALDR